MYARVRYIRKVKVR